MIIFKAQSLNIYVDSLFNSYIVFKYVQYLNAMLYSQNSLSKAKNYKYLTE